MQLDTKSGACALAPATGDVALAVQAPRQWVREIGGQLLFVALVATYLLPGVIGHDPWKQDETYIADIVRHMLDTGDWTVPAMAGAPFMEKPPLFYWAAAVCARLFSPTLPLHDGARLATPLFLAGTCAATAIASRTCWNDRHGKLAVVVLLSCLGLAHNAHLMLTDVAMLFGFSVALCGLLLCCRSPEKGGLILGTGAGIAFLGKGLYAPGVLAVSAVLLPLMFAHWRQRSYLRALGIGLVAALPWLAIWPSLLFERSPELLKDWIWTNNVGRFFGFSVAALGAAHTPWFWVRNLPWIAFPALPLALLALWRMRANAMTRPPLQLAITLCAVLLMVLGCSASARDNYALPLLVPLALIAAPAAESLPRWVDRGWAWCACALFGAITIAIWLGWTWMMAEGRVPAWPFTSAYLPLQFLPTFSIWRLLAALAATALPLWLASTARGFAGNGLRCWFVGLSVAFASLAVLWEPWIDAAKSYRSVFESVRHALPAHPSCLSESGVGESERAMLHYFLGLSAVSGTPAPGCDAHLIEGVAGAAPTFGADGVWTLVWSGARPGDNDERFWLYIRAPRTSGSPALARQPAARV